MTQKETNKQKEKGKQVSPRLTTEKLNSFGDRNKSRKETSNSLLDVFISFFFFFIRPGFLFWDTPYTTIFLVIGQFVKSPLFAQHGTSSPVADNEMKIVIASRESRKKRGKKKASRKH